MAEGTASSSLNEAIGTARPQRKRRWVTQDTRRGMTLLSPILLLFMFALALPIFLLFAISFWTQTGLRPTPDFTFDNYLAFFERPVYATLLRRSIENSALVALITVVLAYPAAYFVAFKVKKNKAMWLILITIPFWTSYLLRVFAWKVVLGYGGVINSGLMTVGLIEEPLTFLLNNRQAVIITLAHAWAAFAILPIYVSLEKIDRTYLEAASDLGEGPIGQFFRVTLPLSMPGIIAAALVIFIPTVGDYVTPLLVGGNNGLMISNVVQVQFGRGSNWPLGSAISVISMITITGVVCIFLLLTQQLKRRLT